MLLHLVFNFSQGMLILHNQFYLDSFSVWKVMLRAICFTMMTREFIYPCGHNVAIYNIDEKTQTYISGVDGSEGITAMTVSPSRKYVAFAKKLKEPLPSFGKSLGYLPILQLLQREKGLDLNWLYSQRVISVAFAPTNEKSLLCTLVSPILF